MRLETRRPLGEVDPGLHELAKTMQTESLALAQRTIAGQAA